jgi:hypothetical protein
MANPLLGPYADPSGNPLTASTPTAADAWDYNAQAVSDYVAQQRAQAASQGLWDPATGLPTKAGITAAAGSYANALLAGTTAPVKAQWFHGTSSAFDRLGTPEVYMTNSPEQAAMYAQDAHRLGAQGVGQPTVLPIRAKDGAVRQVDDHLAEAMEEGEDVGDTLETLIAETRKHDPRVRYLEYTHPNAGDQGEHTVRVSLYPQTDLGVHP